MSDDLPALPTALGHAGWKDHEVRGVTVFDLDHRRTSMIELTLLALGIDLEADEARAVITLCAQAVLNPDPRIPPMKLLRLGSAHGHAQTALAVGLAGMRGSYVGMSAIGDSAKYLHGIVTEVGWSATDEQIDAALAARRDARTDIFGFGVPGRPSDERFLWISSKLEEVIERPRPWWAMFERIGAAFEAAKRFPNVSGAIAATLLDLGCTPQDVDAIACLFTLPPLLGNAYEGAEQSPPVLQRLPPSTVEYVGPAPRPSPRAVAARSESMPSAPPETAAAAQSPRDE